MQGKQFENKFFSSMDLTKVENLRQIFEWLQSHTEICDLYVNSINEEEKFCLKERLDFSLKYGKLLFDSILSEPVQYDKAPLIPLSGVNRFSAPANDNTILRGEKLEGIYNKNPSFKLELGKVCNLKKMQMPSRTYLKKK